MPVLMQFGGDEPRIMVLVYIVFGLILLGIAGVIAFFVLTFVFGVLFGAFQKPLLFIKYFLVSWACMSGCVWLLEGNKLNYGWAAAISMIDAILWSALMGLASLE